MSPLIGTPRQFGSQHSLSPLSSLPQAALGNLCEADAPLRRSHCVRRPEDGSKPSRNQSLAGLRDSVSERPDGACAAFKAPGLKVVDIEPHEPAQVIPQHAVEQLDDLPCLIGAG